MISPRSQFRNASRIGLAAVRFAVVFAWIGCLLGFVISQYYPFTGGILIHVSEPFSPSRLQVAPAHFLLGGIVGLVGGAALGTSLAARRLFRIK